MASTMSLPSLPAKKRKASNASSSLEGSENREKMEEKTKTTATTISESRLPSKKRKGSHDSAVQKEQKRKESHDSTTSNRKGSNDLSDSARRKLSHDSSENGKKRKGSNDLSVQFEDIVTKRNCSRDSSTLHNMEAPRKESESSDSGKIYELLALAPEPAPVLKPPPELPGQSSSAALEHLDALGAAVKPADTTKQKYDGDDHSNSLASSSGQRLLLEAIMIANAGGGSHSGGSGLDSAARAAGRDRLESWGAMSDLSAGHLGGESDSAAAAIAHSALQHTGIIEDVRAAATTDDDGDRKPSAIPSRISLERERLNSLSLSRDRLNSITSWSEASISGLPNMVVDGIDMTGEIQAFVAAAVASVGDQLAELAGAVENAAAAADDATLDALRKSVGIESDISSAASPIIGATSDGGAGRGRGARTRGRPRSCSASSEKISVDYEAVASAVEAAQAATGSLDLETMSNKDPPSTSSSLRGRAKEKPRHSARRQLPLKRARGASSGSDEKALGKSTMSEKEAARIRKRARAAAGYIPPVTKGQPGSKKMPIKKRVKRKSPEPDKTMSLSAHGTPKVSNRRTADYPDELPYAPLSAPSATVTSKENTKGQADQKWESNFKDLLQYIKERREEETQGLAENEKKAWVFCGNVPTTYKTKEGKALGRWVNNQRSAKNKATLKDDRERRLVEAGLKWSVLASNSWNLMLDELKIYMKEQVDRFGNWNGNVPTNYQIKARADGRFAGEDKNLGRWVNRQRSLYQSGKLRKDRQTALEKVGLKWSMLATNSWDSMYDLLCEYVEQQKKETGSWDGSVPANFRTDENPPRALGRWVNRQRSAYGKNKLKKEYVEKLNALGFKWSVHDRIEYGNDDRDDDNGGTDATATTSKEENNCDEENGGDEVETTIKKEGDERIDQNGDTDKQLTTSKAEDDSSGKENTTASTAAVV